MFKKPFHAKPTAPLRSSERRGLIKQLGSDYGLSDAVAQAVVPDGLLSGKALTHLDEPCTLLSDPNSGDVLFVRVGKGNDGWLFPTLYTLLKARAMLPILATPAFVLEKMRDGSDLFAGGLSPASVAALPTLKEGSLVAVASVTDASTPRAVGQLACDSTQLSADGKGKAVLTLHAYGDWLWNAGSKVEPENIMPIASTSATTIEDAKAADSPGEPAANGDQASPAGATLTPADVDAVLRMALLLAIKKTLSKDAKAFPLPASSVYSGHVLPCRPASSGQDVDIKKSSYKKLTAFMKKEGLLTIKETKQDLLVLSVKADHPAVVAQKSYKTVADAGRQAAAQDQPVAAAPKSIKVTELYAPHGSTLAFWSAAGHSGDDTLTAQKVRHAFSDYVTEHQLAYAADAKYVKPDDAMASVLGERGSGVSEAVPRNEVVDALLASMQRWHLLDTSEGEPVKRKGPGPRIEMSVQQRKGRNVVTCIKGLEVFTLNPEEVASALQIVCSTSTTVLELQQSTAKKPLHEVTVQGDQTKLVTQYLVEHGVPKGSIDTVPLKRK